MRSCAVCSLPHHAHGFCSKHAARWRDHGTTGLLREPYLQAPLATRFWAKVDKSGECWLWTGSTSKKGYGQIARTPRIPALAHRVSWELHFGPIPDGLFVCHTCDVPGCVRPGHLWLGTNRDNMLDCAKKGRTTAGRVNPRLSRAKLEFYRIHPEKALRGAAGGNVRISTAHVIEARQRYAQGGVSARTLGREYGISESQMFRILHRVCWVDTP